MSKSPDLFELRKEQTSEFVDRICQALPDTSTVLSEPTQQFIDFIWERPFVQGLVTIIQPRYDHQLPRVVLCVLATEPVDIVRDGPEMRIINKFVGSHFQPIEDQVDVQVIPFDPDDFPSTEYLVNHLQRKFPSVMGAQIVR